MERFSLKRLFSRQSSSERRNQSRMRPPQGTTVLIVDDSKTVVHMVRRLLEQDGYTTMTAFDGESGIETAKAHRPDLIIMDVVMPGINGFEATRQLRKDPATADIPIIIMSGNKEATEQFWAVRIGANDFMVKPFQRGTLFQKVERQLFEAKVA